MARNIELKARISDLEAIRTLAASLTGAPSERLHQVDTFFDVPLGRLKVRALADGSGELIAYHRPNHAGLKESVYTRFGCPNAHDLVETLGHVLPVRGTVVKRREVFLVGRTRIHLDQVERLGSFLELEVVLRDGEPTENGVKEGDELLRALGVPRSALVAGAYIDLLQRMTL